MKFEQSQIFAKEQLGKLVDEETALTCQNNDLSELISNLGDELKQCADNSCIFDEYLKKDKENCGNIEKRDKILADDEKALWEIKNLKQSLEDLLSNLSANEGILRETEITKRVLESNFAKFANFEMTEILNDSMQVLEERYNLLTSNSANDIKEIEGNLCLFPR